jgi:hypothetical protein
MAGLLGQIFSAGNVAKRQLRDLLGNPVLGAQQMAGNLNDRARNLNEMTAAAAREGMDYGPATQRLAGLMADAYNPMGLTVFHGSPAKFNRFDRTKIGSGEGAQAYGYGHYVAESPETAKQYKETLKSKAFSKIVKKDRNVYDVVAPDGALISEGTMLGTAHKAKDAYDANVGALYEIDLPDEQIAKMIGWDRPIKEQSKEIQDIAQSLGLQMDDLGGDIIARIDAKRPEGAEKLRQAGIPGIQYYDAQSRGGQPATTQNFVIFPGNEDLLTILRRNGGLLD